MDDEQNNVLLCVFCCYMPPSWTRETVIILLQDSQTPSMIDIDLLRAYKGGDPGIVVESEQKRGKSNCENAVSEIISVDERWRACRHDVDTMRKERAVLTKTIRDKVRANLAAEDEKKQSKSIAKEIAEKEAKMEVYQESRTELLRKIGNILDSRVPKEEDVEIKRWGEIDRYAIHGNVDGDVSISQKTDCSVISQPKKKGSRGKKGGKNGNSASPSPLQALKAKKVKSHVELCELVNGMESERGTSVAGKRGYFLRGPLVLLKMVQVCDGLSVPQSRQSVKASF